MRREAKTLTTRLEHYHLLCSFGLEKLREMTRAGAQVKNSIKLAFNILRKSVNGR